MKESLLILGDSFANDRKGCLDFTGPAWTTLLETDSKYKVVNKSAGGSSLYYSYLEFNQHHENYTKIMLVITQPGRLYCPILGFEKTGEVLPHHTSSFWIERFKNKVGRHQPNNLAAIKQLCAIQDYFLYIADYTKDRQMNQLMLDDMKRKRPDIVLVPAFQESWLTSPPPTSWLCQIADMEMKHYNLTYEDLNHEKGYEDARKCHMSDRNNQILFEKSLKWLEGESVEFKLSDFEKPTEPREKYFPTIDDYKSRSNK